MSKPSSVTRTPAGLLIPTRAALRGRVRWQVLDDRGVPEIPRSPSGFAIAPIEGVAQPNLITDLGLDAVASEDVFSVSPSSTLTWRRRLAVGTGSTEPDPSDTALDAEVQRDATSGTFSNGSNAYELDTDANLWRATSLVTRLVTMTADRNLTEFGLAQATTADLRIRELFRDELGDPVTISLLNGKTVRLDHTLTVEIDAPPAGTAATLNVEEYDAANVLVDTIAYDIVFGGRIWSANSGTIASTLPEIFEQWNPQKSGSFGVSARRVRIALAYTRESSAQMNSTYVDPETGLAASAETYSAGSYQRIRRVTFPTGTANGEWHGIWFSDSTFNQSARHGGIHVQFDGPAFYEKVNTDTLRVGLVSTWARATEGSGS